MNTQLTFSTRERAAALDVQEALVAYLEREGCAKWRLDVEREALAIMRAEVALVAEAEGYVAAANE